MPRKESKRFIYRRNGDLFLAATTEIKQEKPIAQGWLMNAGVYPKVGASGGAGMQFFRSAWFNDRGNGLSHG